MLMRANDWARETFFKGSRPGRKKIVEWILSGEVPGKIIDGEPYVEADQFAAPTAPVSSEIPDLLA